MPRTRTQLRQRVARELGFDIYATGTADTGGSTTTLKDSPLQLRPDDYYIGAYVYLSSGTPTFTDLEVTDSTQSTGLLTFRPTLSAAPDTITYEVLPFPASKIHEALQDTLDEVFEEGILQREFTIKSLVGGSPAYNAGFEYWDAEVSAVPHGYETVSGSTVVKETTIVPISNQSMKLTSTLVQPTEFFRRYFHDFIGESVSMYCWVYTTAASKARINLRYVDGGSTTDNNSDYHTGNAGWELLSVENISIPSTAEDIRPIFDGGSTASYFGDWWLVAQQSVLEDPFPIDLAPKGPESIEQQVYADYLTTPAVMIHEGRKRPYTAECVVQQDEASTTAAVRRGTIYFADAPQISHRLYLRCLGPLTMPVLDANVIELNISEAAIVCKRAAVKLLEKNRHRFACELAEQVNQRIQRLEAEAARMT